MLRLGKSILGAALLAGLTATAVVTPTQSADARPVWGPHSHWVHGWHDGRYGWWWAGPDIWYSNPAPAYYDYYGLPPPGYVAPAAPAAQFNWYYCDSAKGYYPYVRSCAGGWRAVAANPPQGQNPSTEQLAPPAPPGTSKS
jgi:hypothetical protein